MGNSSWRFHSEKTSAISSNDDTFPAQENGITTGISGFPLFPLQSSDSQFFFAGEYDYREIRTAIIPTSFTRLLRQIFAQSPSTSYSWRIQFKFICPNLSLDYFLSSARRDGPNVNEEHFSSAPAHLPCVTATTEHMEAAHTLLRTSNLLFCNWTWMNIKEFIRKLIIRIIKDFLDSSPPRPKMIFCARIPSDWDWVCARSHRLFHRLASLK